LIRFGVDDGAGNAQAYNEVLEQDEVRETLNFCFEALSSERVSDVFASNGNSMTTGCDEAVWSKAASGFFFAANDGVNGCELHVHHPEANTTTMVVDLHPNGDAMPGRDLGLTVLKEGAFVLFDATDGTSPRQLWVTDGTANGTEALGTVEAWSPRPWGEGMLFRSTSNQFVWTDGSNLQNDLLLPSWSPEVRQAVQANLSSLSQLGQAWIHTDEQALWFSAADENGDVEPYRLSVEGALTAWTINDFGSTQLSNLLTVGNDALAVGVRGGVKQVLQLHDNGTHAWLTSIAPVSGDTHLGEGMGLHLIGDNLVYDAITSSSEARLWTTNLANGITVQLSNTVQAPGAQVGVANTGERLLFDCLTPSHGLEVCITDGTPQGSRVLHDLTPGLMSSDIRGMAPVGDDWVVVASGSVNGTAQGVVLWAVEGTAMRLVYDPWPGSGNSSQALNYGALVLSPTQAWFVAHDGVHGHEWHRWSHGELSDDWIVTHR
jgi:ELWxxDGT repeat protein